MNKAKINLIIDALMFLCIAGISGIGLLVKYVLVPGVQRWEIYGRNVELLFWGMDRHSWGSIHYVIGLALIFLLALHIILHWKMVVGIARRLLPNRWVRRITAVVLICLAILLVGFSAFVKPQIQELGRGRGYGWQQSEFLVPSTDSQ